MTIYRSEMESLSVYNEKIDLSLLISLYVHRRLRSFLINRLAVYIRYASFANALPDLRSII